MAPFLCNVNESTVQNWSDNMVGIDENSMTSQSTNTNREKDMFFAS